MGVGRRQQRRWYWVFAIFGVAGVASILFIRLQSSPVRVVSPLPAVPTEERSTPSIFSKKKNPQDLKNIILDQVDDTWSNYSVYIQDYNSDFSLGINEDVVFTAASVNKIPILASLYYLAQDGEIDLDKIITLQEPDIQDYGTGVIRYDPPGTTYSVKTLARLMIQKSDNTAAFLLGNYVIGLDKVQKIIEGWGLTQTDMTNNQTSNRDMALLFEKIMKGQIANQAETREMLSFLSDSDFEDRIPKLLPDTVSVYHKIGSEVRIIHDVGVVSKGKVTYYIGILTSDVLDEEKTVDLIAKISKSVYDFLL